MKPMISRESTVYMTKQEFKHVRDGKTVVLDGEDSGLVSLFLCAFVAVRRTDGSIVVKIDKGETDPELIRIAYAAKKWREPITAGEL